MGTSKRWPALPKQAKHGDLSKSTIHEALLDLWMEHTGRDVHPSNLSAADWAEYHKMIEERSAARQRQGRSSPERAPTGDDQVRRAVGRAALARTDGKE